MSGVNIPKSPNVFDPVKPSAVGSRNSLAQMFRDQQAEVDKVVNEEIDKILQHVTSKLPKDVLDKLDVMGGLKEKLYNYYNQNYQNMFNRYITTTEDEMVKKIRNFVDKEELKTLSKYTPREIAQLLDQIGGMDKFNTGEIEKSIINMYGHLQGHVQRGINDLENETNSILRQKADVGAFVRGENAYSIVKCSFKDNHYKPKAVTDTKLSVNILDSELISPIFHYQTTVEFLIKDLISKHIQDQIDKEINILKDQLTDEGKDDLSDTEIIFEKIKRVENYTSDDSESPESLRYQFLAKALMEKIEGLRAEIPMSEYDSLNIRENIKKIIDIENIRNRGFNTSINSITSILDTSKMGYQYIENLKNARDCIIREYEDTDVTQLPDERYAIKLTYYDQEQLSAERVAYDRQYEAFKKEVYRLWEIVDELYRAGKGRKMDFIDLAAKVTGKINKKKAKLGHEELDDYVVGNNEWNEVTFIKPEDTEVQESNRSYIYEKDDLKVRFIKMREKLSVTFENQNPVERVAAEDRLDFLLQEYNKFEYNINPYHIQPGIVLDIDITSIKRKKYTLNSMANVLNEFLHGVSKGFMDAAFASYSRRRSTVRADIEQTFGLTEEEHHKAELEETASKTLIEESSPSVTSAPEGIVDVSQDDDLLKEM